MTVPAYHLQAADGTRLAYRHQAGTGPAVVFLGGFRSDMGGQKACHLEDWCARSARASLCLDYRGHGASGGRFEDACVSDWADDAWTVVQAALAGSFVLVGSSMGGWIGALIARRLHDSGQSERLAGFVGVAAAPDFTEHLLWPRLDSAAREAIRSQGVALIPSSYDDGPYPITRRLLEDGRRQQVLTEPLPIACRVRLLHGTADPDVPWALSEQLLRHVTSTDATLTLVKGGGHRLSEPPELALLERAVVECLALD